MEQTLGLSLRFSSNVSLSLVSALESIYKPTKRPTARGEQGNPPKQKSRRRMLEDEDTDEIIQDEPTEKETIDKKPDLLEEDDNILQRRDLDKSELELLAKDVEKPKKEFSLVRNFHGMIKKVKSN